MSAAVQQHLFGPTPDAEQSQWFTPDWLAARVVEWANLPGRSSVVELGAGDGAFMRPLMRAGHYVWAVERDERFVGALRRDPLLSEHVVHADALTWAPLWSPGTEFTAYIGNPPYENDADIAFVERGLELAPRAVVVLRLVFEVGLERYERIWSKHHLARKANLVRRPIFIGEKPAGTGGGRTDFAVFDIRRGPAPAGHAVITEWWI